jgi:parallel beta-helix repeat protein
MGLSQRLRWSRGACAAALGLAASGFGAGCLGHDNGGGRRFEVRDVPRRYPTIQAAVDAARPGDLVRIAPGTYRESVDVPASTPRIVIRGLDRGRVVLDGGGKLVNGVRVRADGVAVENLTVRRYVANGVLFAPPPGSDRPLTGYRASYVTAADNGLYGVYALSAERGRFDHLYASGNPDSGIYIGQCSPCRALVIDSVAEHNMVGYENTNASGELVVARSVWRRNRVGIALNSQEKERLAPQRDVVLVGNRVEDNDDPRAPRGGDAFGVGIVVSGGSDNLVERNLVTGHSGFGILLSASVDGYLPRSNRVRDNVLEGNRVDLAVQGEGDVGPLANCFSSNRYRRSSPAGIEAALPCGRAPTGVRGSRLPLPLSPPGPRRRTSPPPQPDLPLARTSPPRPATGLPQRVDPDRFGVP